MAQEENTYYKLTSEGRTLWARRRKVALPEEYRRILGLVEFCGHKAVIRSNLGRFSESQVEDWLSEFEASHLIEAISAAPPRLSRIARRVKAPPIEESDAQQITEEASFADISLNRLGVYVSDARARHRPQSLRSPKDSVALVVEDDPDQLALAVLRLTLAGYPVHTADSVAATYRWLTMRSPDALFLDVMLPDGDGFDVLTTLRRHPTFAMLPIVLVTAKVEPADVAKGLALGADAYITKPYGKSTLDYVLRYVTNQPLPLRRTEMRGARPSVMP